MPLKDAYVIARSAGGRPTLQHKLVDGQTTYTRCGRSMQGWSVALSRKAIEPVLCKQAACRA